MRILKFASLVVLATAILATAIHAQDLVSIDVSKARGLDVGAKISAADAMLGSHCGTLVVPETLNGQVVKVQPKVGRCHTLQLNAALIWRVSPRIANKTTILGNGRQALQTLPWGDWIAASDLSGITIRNLWFTVVENRPHANAGSVLSCAHCSNLLLSGVHATRESLLTTKSTSPSYATSTPANSCSNVQVENSFVDGEGVLLTAVLLSYVNHAGVRNLTVKNLAYGVQWWGGDANGDGATSNPRRTSDIKIDTVNATNVVAAVWGSMGQNIIVNRVTADTCGDVCIDGEGSFHVAFTNYDLRNAVNGAIATFFSSQDVSFGPGTITCDHAAKCSLAHFFNVSQNPTAAVRIDVHDTQFICRDPSALCVISGDPVGGLTLTNNTFLNATFSIPFNASGITLTRNAFHFTLRPPAPFNAVDLALVGNFSRTNLVADNTFTSTVPQTAGTFAVTLHDIDFNNSNTSTISGNTTSGFANDVHVVAAGANPGITPTFRFTGNHFGSNSVKTDIKGAHGNFVGLP